jgi:hypothetical protein
MTMSVFMLITSPIMFLGALSCRSVIERARRDGLRRTYNHQQRKRDPVEVQERKNDHRK